MRIVYVITRADAVGGASIHVRDLARIMHARGHETCVLVGGHGHVTEQLEAAGVPFKSLHWLRRSINPFFDAMALVELCVALRRLKPDLVSTHTAKAGSIGRAACRLLGIPVIYTPHGWSAGKRMPRMARLAFGFVERLMAKWCDAIICVCEHEKRLALEKGIADEEKLAVVLNGVRNTSEQFRADPGLTPVRLCSIARFDAPKDYRTLLEALALLPKTGWEIDLLGDGPQEPSIRRLARKLGLSDKVRFRGYVPDTSGWLARAQIFVLSSRSEALPRSILEALCAGLPVVATDVGGTGEAVTHGVNGLLVPPEDRQALAAALGKLAESAPLRRQMGEAARKLYEQRFRLEVMADLTSAVYATVQIRTAKAE